jgi:hypothetical protein
MSQDRAYPHYIPAAALKRFADDLGNESSTNKFLQINRERVNSFIEKPFADKLPSSSTATNKAKRKTQVVGVNDYNLSNEETNSFIHLQNLPEFQGSLGIRSRFGDGDGSFFDKWLNSDAMTSRHVLDKDGLPVMK